MKKFWTLLCAILTYATTVMAYDVMVDGIAYNYNSDNTALVVTYTSLDDDNYSGLTEAVIPSMVIINGESVDVFEIGDFAFYKCKSLESIKISSTISAIGDRALAYCPKLATIDVDRYNLKYNSSGECNAIVETRQHILVAGCSTTEIPNNIYAIEAFAFAGSSSLKDVNLPNSLVKIGYEAFAGTGLTEVVIPESVQEIGYRAFAHCDSLNSITVNSINEKYDSRSNCNAIIEKASGSIIAACKATSFPADVNTIGYEGFSGCGDLKTMIIPSSISEINHYAFEDCTDINTLDVPGSVTFFGDRAFADCTGLQKVYARLTEPQNAEYVNMSTFDGVPVETCPLFVNDELIELYRATMPWSEFLIIKGFSEDAGIPGDINLDGIVDISDLNILINIILGKDQVENYDRRPYITDDETLDVSDVNGLINIILGK